VLEDHCFYNSVPAEIVTMAIIKYVSFVPQFMLRYELMCSVKVTTSVWSAVFPPWHSSAVVLPHVYCLVDNTVFEVTAEIHCYGVSSLYCCYGNHTAGSQPS